MSFSKKNLNTSETIPNNIFTFLFFFIKKFKFGFLILITSAVVYAVCQTLLPYFIKLVINTATYLSINNSSDFNQLKKTLFLLGVLWIIGQIIINTQGMYVFKIIPNFKSLIKYHLFTLISHYQDDFFISHKVEVINKKINDLASSSEKIIQVFIFNFITIATAFFISIVIMYQVSFLFSLLLVSWYISHFLLSYPFLKKGMAFEENYFDNLQKTNAVMDDILNNLFNVKLFNNLKLEHDTLSKMHIKEIKSHRTIIMNFEKMKLLQNLFSVVFIILTIFLLSNLWDSKKISIGDIAMISMLSFAAINFVWQLSNQLTIFTRELGVLKASLNIINLEQGHSLKPSDNVTTGIIEFKNVSFKHDKKDILNSLSITIKPEDKIGIIGNSGLGKTTFIKLLLGIYKSNSGEILIDGKNIQSISKTSWYEKITIVTQDIKLLNRSIIENIKYGNHSATEEEIYNAAKMACCHEFIMQLSNGYNTIIGENGIKLSGGQKQRIALARMIIKNSPIVIMDEPSSALDAITENEIFQNITNFLKNKTLLIVSHKTAFLKIVNSVYCFKNGKLEKINKLALEDS